MAFVARQDAISGVSVATVTLTVPTHSTGDTLVAFVGGWDDGVGPTAGVPPNVSGGMEAWILLNGVSNGTIGGGLWCFIRPASDTELSTYVWTWATGTRLFGSMLSYSSPIGASYHCDQTTTGNDASGSKTTTITSHARSFTDATFVYAELAQASGANFGAGSIAPDAATTDRGTIKENSNCGMLNVADEVIAGAGTEPARSWVDTWTESGGGHRSVLMRAVILGPSAAAAGGDAWAYMS